MTQDKIAQLLDEAARTATAVEQVAETNGISLEEAYEIQRLSIAKRKERGEKQTGYKLGFTSYAKMEQMGVHDLIWGLLTDEMTIQPDEEVNMDRWIHPRAEPEIAFKIKKAIDKALTLEELPDYVDHMAAAIEVIDSRYKNFKFSLEDVVADNCSSTGYVIGKWHDLDLDSVKDLNIELIINDECIEKGNTSAILNNPLQSLVELSRLASEAGLTIEKGHIVLAGAATAAVYLKRGDRVIAKLEELGSVGFSVKK